MPPDTVFDPVHRPAHYTAGAVEAIDVIRQATSLSFSEYCRGNALKYLLRAGQKAEPAQDYAKAAWYCQMAAHVMDHERYPDPRGARDGWA